MKVAVTGSNGFIGTNLCAALEAAGDEVVRVGRYDWNFSDVDAIVHLGAYGTKPSQRDQIGFTDSMEFTANIVTTASALGIPCVVAGSVVETIPITSLYAASKLFSTLAAREAGAVVLRLTTPYGPHEAPHRLVPSLIEYGLDGEYPRLSNPSFLRDFVYVEDVVGAIRLAIGVTPGVYTVGSGILSPLSHIVLMARQYFGIKKSPKWGDDDGRAWESVIPYNDNPLPGWSATTDFMQGLRKTVKWVKSR